MSRITETRQKIDHGQLWLAKYPVVENGIEVWNPDYLILLHYAPHDWNPSRKYDTGLRLIRTHLRYGLLEAKPKEYVMEDMRWLFDQHPKDPKYWTWNLYWHADKKLFYERLIHTWS